MGEAVQCPYCDKPARLVDSAVIYGKSYGLIYLCEFCRAYVGVHKGTTKPLGSLGNRETREARKLAHSKFDPLWKSGRMRRKKAYKMLADALGVKEIHIGESDVETCNRIVEASATLAKEAA